MSISRQARHQQAHLAAGRCRCGRYKCVPGRRRCAGCILKTRIRNRSRRTRKLPRYTDAQLLELRAQDERAAQERAS